MIDDQKALDYARKYLEQRGVKVGVLTGIELKSAILEGTLETLEPDENDEWCVTFQRIVLPEHEGMSPSKVTVLVDVVTGGTRFFDAL